MQNHPTKILFIVEKLRNNYQKYTNITVWRPLKQYKWPVKYPIQNPNSLSKTHFIRLSLIPVQKNNLQIYIKVKLEKGRGENLSTIALIRNLSYYISEVVHIRERYIYIF